MKHNAHGRVHDIHEVDHSQAYLLNYLKGGLPIAQSTIYNFYVYHPRNHNERA
jgi:hypothetical protein